MFFSFLLEDPTAWHRAPPLPFTPSQPTQMLEGNGVNPSKRPFLLTEKGLDPLLIPALRVQRATDSELELAATTPWGESLGARVS